MLYYLYWLKRRGVIAKGMIDYPLLRRKQAVELTEEKEKEIEKILDGIKQTLSSSTPPTIEKKTYCRKCSYYELCWDVAESHERGTKEDVPDFEGLGRRATELPR